LFSFGVALDKDWKVSFASDNGVLSGEVTIFRTVWVFPRPQESLRLQPTMLFQRNMINGIFSVKVKPDIDVIANIK